MTSGVHKWRADFVVFDETGKLAAVAEAKKKPGADLPWAIAWLRNYLAHEHGVPPQFVLLATPERVYLWQQPGTASPDPTAVADARGLFSSYLHRSNADPAHISGRTFEFIVGAWLNDLSHRLWEPSNPEQVRVFVDTGLLEAIENGRVVSDIAA